MPKRRKAASSTAVDAMTKVMEIDTVDQSTSSTGELEVQPSTSTNESRPEHFAIETTVEEVKKFARNISTESDEEVLIKKNAMIEAVKIGTYWTTDRQELLDYRVLCYKEILESYVASLSRPKMESTDSEATSEPEQKRRKTSQAENQDQNVNIILNQKFSYLSRKSELASPRFCLFELLDNGHERFCKETLGTTIFDPFAEEEELDKQFKVEEEGKNLESGTKRSAEEKPSDFKGVSKESCPISSVENCVKKKTSDAESSDREKVFLSPPQLAKVKELKLLVQKGDHDGPKICQLLDEAVTSVIQPALKSRKSKSIKISSESDSEEDVKEENDLTKAGVCYLKQLFEVAKTLYGRRSANMPKSFNRLLNRIPITVKSLEQTNAEKQEITDIDKLAKEVCEAISSRSKGSLAFRRGDFKSRVVKVLADSTDSESKSSSISSDVAFLLIDSMKTQNLLKEVKREYVIEITAGTADSALTVEEDMLKRLEATAAARNKKRKERSEKRKIGKNSKKSSATVGTSTTVIRVNAQ